jgi:glycosyltransferase involved in cell wall biosynthesis
MEATAMGVPVVASDIPGCREVIRHGETGLLFAPRDAAALTGALRAALADPAAARARAEAALRDVRARFDQDALSERVWGVHAELLGAPADR